MDRIKDDIGRYMNGSIEAWDYQEAWFGPNYTRNYYDTIDSTSYVYIIRTERNDTGASRPCYMYNFYTGDGSPATTSGHTVTYRGEDVTQSTFTDAELNNGQLWWVGFYNSDISKSHFFSTIPIFSSDNTTALDNYKKTGDTSGALNKDDIENKSAETTIYLDGSVPPNITICWESTGDTIPDHMNVVIYATPTYGAEEGKTELSRTLYSWGDSGVSFTWGSLENLMYGGDVPNIIIETNYKGATDNIATAYIDSDGKNYQPSERTYSSDGKNSIQVVVGEPPSDEENSDQKEQEKSEASENENEENTNINTASLLTRTYQLTREQLQSLGNFLWSDSFFDNIKLINNSPIENVVSVKAIPCDFLTEASKNIVLGNVETTVQGNPVTNNYIKKKIGTVKVANQDNSFIDYDDCDILLYLPLIGTITDLNPREVMGYTITLKYCYDAITGDVIAEIFNNRAGKENIIGVYRGNCGVDIPLTASNRAQVEAGYISDTISGVASVVSKNPLGVVNAGMSALTRMHTSHSTGSVSGATAQGLPNKAYLTIITSLPQKVTKVFRHTYGRVCCNNHKLGDLNGYTMCDDKIDLSSISCTETEKEELRSLLATGVYL